MRAYHYAAHILLYTYSLAQNVRFHYKSAIEARVTHGTRQLMFCDCALSFYEHSGLELSNDYSYISPNYCRLHSLLFTIWSLFFFIFYLLRCRCSFHNTLLLSMQKEALYNFRWREIYSLAVKITSPSAR